jgi:homoserine kinase
MNKGISAYAPASVSNVACGFDIMGFAIDQPGDIVTVRLTANPGVHIRSISGISCSLPTDVTRNTAAAPVIALLKHSKTCMGAEIDIHKGIPVSGGIGSSAASAVAAAMACNTLLDLGMSKQELLPFAIEGERIASGAVHVDNLAPSLLGGFCLIRGYDPIDIVPVRAPRQLWCTVLHPHMEINTRESRQLLPRHVPLADLVRQTGNAAGLIAGLLQENFGLISRSLHDVVAEPARKHMIPGFDSMKETALASGALGCSISGSGPSLFALSTSEETANAVGLAMGSVLTSLRHGWSVVVSGISQAGARIIPADTDEPA